MSLIFAEAKLKGTLNIRYDIVIRHSFSIEDKIDFINPREETSDCHIC